MRHWENYTCVKFVERTPEHPNYIVFTERPCGLVLHRHSVFHLTPTINRLHSKLVFNSMNHWLHRSLHPSGAALSLEREVTVLRPYPSAKTVINLELLSTSWDMWWASGTNTPDPIATTTSRSSPKILCLVWVVWHHSVCPFTNGVVCTVRSGV